MRAGELFSGYGGPSLATEAVSDACAVWHTEVV